MSPTHRYGGQIFCCRSDRAVLDIAELRGTCPWGCLQPFLWWIYPSLDTDSMAWLSEWLHLRHSISSKPGSCLGRKTHRVWSKFSGRNYNPKGMPSTSTLNTSPSYVLERSDTWQGSDWWLDVVSCLKASQRRRPHLSRGHPTRSLHQAFYSETVSIQRSSSQLAWSQDNEPL